MGTAFQSLNIIKGHFFCKDLVCYLFYVCGGGVVWHTFKIETIWSCIRWKWLLVY